MKKLSVLKVFFVSLILLSFFSGIVFGQDTTLDKVKKRGKLFAGVKYDTVPFGFVDKSGKVVGFDVDLTQEIAKAIGVEIEYIKVTSPTRIPMLVAGNVDVVAASMTHTNERDRTIDFSITYFIGGQSILVKKGSGINEVKDLVGKTVAVQQGTTLEKNLAEACPEAKQLAFKDYTSAWMALKQGRADALTGSHHILLGFAKNSPDFVLAGKRFSTEPFGMGVRQNDSDMRDLTNRVLQELWTSGKYHEYYRKWFGSDPDFEMEIWP
jgi:polar amino acid transport system substrate-binding protein